jgi:glucose dehydrogenase
LVLLAASAVFAQEWQAWHGGPANTKYSPLRQIDTGNVSRLALAWKYDTEDAGETTEMQCNPLVIDGVLYATTPKHRVIALDAATGRLKWRFDPNTSPFTGRTRNRGLTYWRDGNDRRLFVPWKSWLYALDPDTGRPVPGFGADGRVNLSADLGRDTAGQLTGLNTPGVVYKDLLIVGGGVARGARAHPRLRRPHGQAALDLSHHSAPRGARRGDMAERRVPVPGRGQQLGGHGARREARHRLRAHGLGVVRFLWRQPPRR